MECQLSKRECVPCRGGIPPLKGHELRQLMAQLVGGWRVIETLGMKMTKLQPVHGFCAETAAACSILLSTAGGIPVSTTHTITGAVIGVGATTRLSAVRWGVAYRVFWAWILTIPGTALVAALVWKLAALW